MAKASNDRLDRLRWLKELKDAIPKTSDQVSLRTLEIWSHRLVRIPMPVLFGAANILVERHVFFPALAEILEVCRELQTRDEEREWKRRADAWEAETLPAGEARKLLAEVNERAGTALVTTRKNGMSRVVKRDFEAGADLTNEQWTERIAEQKRRLKEKTSA